MCWRLPFRLHLIQDRFLYCHGCCTIPATFVSVLWTHCSSPFRGNSRITNALFIVLYRTLFPGSVIVICIVQIIFCNIIPGKTINSPFFCSEQLAVFAKRIIAVKNMCKPASTYSALVECGKMQCKSNCRSCQSVGLRWPLIILARLEFITLPGPRCHNRLTEKP